MKPNYKPDRPEQIKLLLAGCGFLLVVAAIIVAATYLASRALGQEPRAAVEESSDRKATPAALGYKLFRDPILSSNGKVSCASCHDPGHAYASHARPPLGLDGRLLTRKAPSLLDRHAGKLFFWDGRAHSLEEQALEVIGNPTEMGGPVRDAVARLAADPKYAGYFREAYGEGPTEANVAACLAAYERTLRSKPGRLDEHLRGTNAQALSAAEARGLELFRGKANCYQCHNGPYLTDERLHDTGLGKFKTPGLRSVRLTAPYMHDASLESLKAVVDFYDRGGNRSPALDPLVKPLGLTPGEKDDLTQFLEAL